MGMITMTQALNHAIDEAMAEDDGVFCLGEDVAAKQGRSEERRVGKEC